jgi:uncharacterized repeat protein (TIGR02543 family)
MSMGNFNGKSAGAKRFKATWRTALWCAILLATICDNTGLLHAQSVPVTVGYRDFYFGKSVNGLLTGEKPQSKLWWNDGLWWGCLWDLAPKKYAIHRFNAATQSWTSTGIVIDSRVDSKGDALWDGQYLYYVSQHYTNSPGPAASGDEGRLYRYSYNSASKSYSLDAGFPVIVNNSVSETLVLAKDSTGKLWVTWTEGGKVKVNRSLGSDLTWGTPFDLPVQGTDIKIDDISSILAFGGNKIGILWSNQNDKKSYFAVHLDGNADEAWEPKEQALADAVLGAVSYDHINLKPSCDSDGNVYAATKTNLTKSGLPLVYLLQRTAAGVWTRYLVSTVDEGYIRPIVLIDGSNHKIYVFATSEASSHRSIYMKSSDLSNIAFPSGLGTPFIQSATDTVIMNPTSTKQCLNGATGLLVLAADQHTRTYLHNYLDLSGGVSQFTLTANLSGSGNVTMDPPGGVYSAGTMVTLTAAPNSGYQFSGWSGDLSGSSNPAAITMDANKSVTATFTVIQHTLTVNTTPQGGGSVALDPPGGTYDAGTMVTLTATPNSGYQFSDWSGDLSGSSNPAMIMMDGNKNVTATFTAAPASAAIVHEETQTGSSSSSTTVTTSANLTGVSGNLYLAAISMQPRKSVVAVTGLGLSWTLVKTQCSGLNTIAVEVWMAQGTPSDDAAVTATFAGAPSATVIAASRYSGVAAVNPVGAVISGNTNGANASATCSGGAASSSYSFDLVTTVNETMVYSAVAMKARTHIPGEGYMERAEIKEVGGSLISSIAVEDKTVTAAGTVTVNGSLSGTADWAEVGLEIRPQGAGPAQHTLTANTVGSGSVTFDPLGGTYGAGTVVTLTATPETGFQFSGWSGDLSGSANPATITMDGSKNVTATFTTSGAIVHEETRTGGSSNSTTVATSANLTGMSGHLYLAAISMQPRKSVVAVSGLGLNWTLVKTQCSGLNTIAVEVWMAQGLPQGGSDASVTATFASAPSAAVVAVSRYSGVDAVNPIGSVISGNTNGANASAVCSGGAASSSYSFDLATTVNEAMVYSAVAMKARTHTPGEGYTERAEIKEVGGSLTSSIAVEDKTIAAAGTVAVNGSLSGTADWVEVGLELKPQATIGKPGVIDSDEKLAAPPSAHRLEQNYPNPFSGGAFGNPSTMIDFALPEARKVTVNIYNETGQLIRTLIDGEMAAGRHAVRWNGRNQLGKTVAAGIYLCQIVARGEDGNAIFTQTRRMTFLK